MDKFRKLYNATGIELDELEGASKSGPFMQAEIRQLMNRGFKLYHPSPDNRRYVYKLKPEDMDILPTCSFISAWKSLQHVKETDYLACPEDATEVYLMPEEVVKSGYSECANGDGGQFRVRSQEEMLARYGELIRDKGSLMVNKSETVLM